METPYRSDLDRHVPVWRDDESSWRPWTVVGPYRVDWELAGPYGAHYHVFFEPEDGTRENAIEAANVIAAEQDLVSLSYGLMPTKGD
ncbi:hypothetical protein [Oceanidesulfovibrio marinus]|uniref:Uncharacterized protein n=1 Tax=Oceanidesulfovibrio marinus TaxID=370038 RepID=A0A6P1ZFJ7_9BACT|nr:hypothetical protein [Oceanidesulfovibrio marinus]TVM31180.1 hypothetical protein DQK91_18900 [Oceanidesulfovibrio marinus]